MSLFCTDPKPTTLMLSMDDQECVAKFEDVRLLFLLNIIKVDDFCIILCAYVSIESIYCILF